LIHITDTEWNVTHKVRENSYKNTEFICAVVTLELRSARLLQ